MTAAPTAATSRVTASGAALNGSRTTTPGGQHDLGHRLGDDPKRDERRRRGGFDLRRLGGQDSPPAVEVRPGQLPIAAEGIDRLAGPLPGVDQVPPECGLARACVVA